MITFLRRSRTDKTNQWLREVRIVVTFGNGRKALQDWFGKEMWDCGNILILDLGRSDTGTDM